METPKKQKLLIVITKSNFGGAQRYVYDVARSLTDAYDVLVACGGEGLMKTRIEETGVRTVSIPYLGRDVNPFKDLLVFFWLIGLLRRERPQILHVNSSKIGGIGGFAGRIMRIPQIIFTAHAWAFNEDRSTLSRAAIAALHWLTVILSRRTIAVSAAVKKQMARFPFMDEKISVVHLGLEAFEPLSRAEARTTLGIESDTFAIGSIAELHPVKGLEFALEAIGGLSFECSYTIIGQGELKESLQTMIDANPLLKRRARLAGFVADASRYAAAFDAFLLPSLSEAFGYVILEAGYSRVPVIATSVGGIPEIIEDMKSGILIHSKSAKEIASSITFLFENKEARHDLGAALYDKISREFSLSKMVKETVAIYEEHRKQK